MSVGIYSIASTALRATYAQLQTTGHNIANVNTPGYSRQEALLSSAGASFTGSGYLGRGVSVADVQRRSDRFLTSELALSSSLNAADRARNRELERLQSLFADNATGVGAAYDDWQLSLADLANQPASASARAAVLARADTLAARVRGLEQQLSGMHGNLNERVRETAASANGLFEQLARINRRLGSSPGDSQVPNDLLDQRDQIIEKINSVLRVSTFINQDHTASIFTVAGQALVVGVNAERIETRFDPEDPARQQVILNSHGSITALDPLGLAGGELAGMLRVRDDDLRSARAALGQMASAIAQSFNQQQARGVDANGQVGSPLFSIGQPIVVPSSENTGSGAITVSVSDATQLAASDYTVSFDGSQYAVTRQSDGLTRVLASLPATIDGVALNISGTPATNDRFTLKVATELASNFSRSLGSGNGLAAAYAMTAQASGSNTGDVSVQSFSVQTATPSSAAPVTITFTSATTFDVSGAGTGNPTNVTLNPGQPIEFNGWQLRLAGVPRAGDSLSIAANTAIGSDNRNARSMLDLARSAFVNGATANDSYAALIADVGTRAQSAQAAFEQSKQVLASATAARAAESGVNLDEEAARMLQFQQAYQAAAKLMSTAQSMFESLLAATS